MNTAVAASSYPAPAKGEDAPDSFWRALTQLNRFRLFVAFSLGVVGLAMDGSFLDLRSPHWFVGICAAYFLVAWVFMLPLQQRQPAFETQLVRHVMVDIACIGSLLYGSGSGPAGPGLLLIVPMAAVGMLRQKRNIFLWTSLASLVVLSQQFWLVLSGQAGLDTLARSGVLAASFFGVALLAHVQTMGVLTASRMAREQGRQAENMARINARMIQELPYAVMAVDGDGEVVQFNAKVEALLGTRFFSRCNLRQCSPLLAELWSRWREHQEIPPHPFQAGRDGRRLIPRFIELEPTRRLGAVVVLEDMTELEAQAQRMKLASLGMLTANLAHEIRNPLSAIRHAAGLLREENAAEVTARLARIIGDNAERLNGLVEDVLALNRRDRMQRQELVLAQVVPSFVTHFAQREQVPEHIIQIHQSGDPRLCMDGNHLEQILWNLLRNAWRYCSRQPGSIRIRMAGLAERVDIDVINDGPAIPAETRTRLFEPFYTTSKQGTGLGLYIARELAEANGGSLVYMEIADGTLFRLSGPGGPCKENGK
jgi:two-component system sensor histidine kinase PilS (NtrC family)